MIYSAGFNSDPDYAYLQEAFDCETMSKLFDVLEEYKTHNDFLKLKVSFQNFLTKDNKEVKLKRSVRDCCLALAADR